MQNTKTIELFVRVGMTITIDPAKIDDNSYILEAIRNGVIDGETYKPDAFFDEDGGIGEKEWVFERQPLVVEKQDQSDTKHEARIVFGEKPSIFDEFSFDTEAELLAFYKGLEAMNGWNDYRHLENLEADDYEHMMDEVPELYKEVCALTGMKLCSECNGLFPTSDLDQNGLCPSCKMDMHYDEIGNCKGCGNFINGGAV